MNTVLTFALCAIAGYLLGNISPSYILGKRIDKKDIRNSGSGNAGTTNVIRSYGFKKGIIVFLLDLLKGALGFLLGWLISGAYLGAVIGGVACIIGHDFPVFLGFRGGKGVSASIGLLVAINPVLGAAVVVLGVLLAAVTKKMSIGSMSGLLAAPVLLAIFEPQNQIAVCAMAFVCALGIFMHRGNITRLIAGQENDLSMKKTEKTD